MSKLTYEYGKALYELACEENAENDFLSEIRIIRAILLSEKELLTVISSPVISKEDRLSLIDRVFSDRINIHIKSFLKLLTERGKAKLIPECLNEFEALWYQNSGIVIAEAESAAELTRAEVGKLHSALERHTGASVELRVTVVPSLIGGVRVRINGELIDGSVRGRLDHLKETLLTKNV